MRVSGVAWNRRGALAAAFVAVLLILPAPVVGAGDADAQVAALEAVLAKVQGTPHVHAGGAVHVHPAAPLGNADLATIGLRPGSGPCLGIYELTGPASEHTCSHGPDPGTGLGLSAVETAAVDAALYGTNPPPAGWTTPTTVPCYTSGPFVQVLWIYPAGQPNRLATFAEELRRTIAAVDLLYSISAAAVAAGNGQPAIRHVKWAHDGSCVPKIVAASVSGGAFGNISAEKSELASKGVINASTKYLAFLDFGGDGDCGGGLAELPGSESTSGSNPNNQGGTWGQVYDCFNDLAPWYDGANAAAHELMHTLGAVGYHSPHSTHGFGHCWDDSSAAYEGNDIMCYGDGYSGSFVRPSNCPITTPETFDCNKDDYYNPNPSAGSYLATHWNAASNQFLSGAAPNSNWTINLPTAALVGGGSYIGGDSATISATTSAPSGVSVSYVEFTVGQDTYDVYSPPYEFELDTFAYTNLANVKVTATPYDQYGYPGHASTATYTVANPQAHLDWPTAFTLTSPVINWTARAHAFGDRSVASVQLTDGYGSPLGAPDTTAPYGGTVDLSSIVDGYSELTSQSLALEVVDTAGVHRTTNPITVYLATSAVSMPFSTYSGYPTRLSSGTVTLPAIVSATQTPAVSKVQFFVNGSKVGEDTSAPYSISWSATAGTSATIVARLIDSAGYVRDSDPTYVEVTTTGLGGSFSSPSTGASISGAAIPATVTPVVPSGWTVDSVDVSDPNGAVYGSLSPVSGGNPNGAWSGTLDGTYASNGTDVLLATITAHDGSFNYDTVTGVPRLVTVANPVPTVTITSPANASKLKLTVSLNASVSGGVPDYVGFRVGGELIATDDAAPYSVSWDTMSGSDGIVRVNAVAGGTWGEVLSAPKFYPIRNLYAWMGSPLPGQTISGKFWLKGGGRCDVDCSLETATFWFDGKAVNYDRAAPYQFLLDTTKYPDGPHTYAITITTNDYRAVSSAIYPVTVDNTP